MNNEQQAIERMALAIADMPDDASSEDLAVAAFSALSQTGNQAEAGRMALRRTCERFLIEWDREHFTDEIRPDLHDAVEELRTALRPPQPDHHIPRRTVYRGYG